MRRSYQAWGAHPHCDQPHITKLGAHIFSRACLRVVLIITSSNQHIVWRWAGHQLCVGISIACMLAVTLCYTGVCQQQWLQIMRLLAALDGGASGSSGGTCSCAPGSCCWQQERDG